MNRDHWYILGTYLNSNAIPMTHVKQKVESEIQNLTSAIYVIIFNILEPSTNLV